MSRKQDQSQMQQRPSKKVPQAKRSLDMDQPQKSARVSKKAQTQLVSMAGSKQNSKTRMSPKNSLNT